MTDLPKEALDRAAFGRLTLGDPQLQERLLAAFLRELPRVRGALRGGAEVDWREELHRLETSCHLIAAPRLLQAVRAGSRSGAVPGALEQELDLAEAAVRRMLQPAPAQGPGAQCASIPR